MYCTHFGFREDPFGSNGTLGCPYPHSNYQKVLSGLHDYVNNNTGVLLLLGPLGIGKSTLLQGVSDERKNYPKNPRFKDLSSYGQLSITARDYAITGLVTQLHERKFDLSKQFDKTIFLLDHADNVNNDFFKTLLNEVKINNTHNHPMLLIVIGTSRLETRLQSTEFETFRSLLNETLRLNRLGANDVKNYILHRLNYAEYSGAQLFNEGAVQRIAELSDGIPRSINTLCGSSLLLASLDQYRFIDEATVNSAADHCFLERKTPATKDVASSNASGKNIDDTESRSDQTNTVRAQSLQQIVTMLNQSVNSGNWNETHRSPEQVSRSKTNTLDYASQPCDSQNTNTEELDPVQLQLVADSPILPMKDVITASTREDSRPKLKPIEHFDISLPDASDNPIDHAPFNSAAGLVCAIVILMISLITWILPLNSTNIKQYKLSNVKTESNSADDSFNLLPYSKNLDAGNRSSSLQPIRETSKVKNDPETNGELPSVSSVLAVSDRINKFNSLRIEPLESSAQSANTGLSTPAFINNPAVRNANKLTNSDKKTSQKTRELLSTAQSDLIEKQLRHSQNNVTDTVAQHAPETHKNKAPPTNIRRHQPASKNRLEAINVPTDKITNFEILADKQEHAARTRASARYRLTQKGVPYDFHNFIASAEEGNEEIVRLFLDANMPVDAQDQLNKNTALIGAASHGHVNAVAAILTKKPAIDRQNRRGRTALMNAAANGHYAISNNLLDHGADVYIKDTNGWNALMHAVDKNQIAIVKTLVAQMTNKNTKDGTGKTALSIAKLHGHEEIIALLQPNL